MYTGTVIHNFLTKCMHCRTMSKNTAHSYFNAAEVVQRFWHQIFIPHIKRNSIFDCLAKITSTRNLEGLSDNSIGFWKPSFNAKPVFAGFEPVRWVSGRNFYLIKTWKKSWHFHFFAKNWVLFQPDQVLTIATWLSVNWRSKKKTTLIWAQTVGRQPRK